MRQQQQVLQQQQAPSHPSSWVLKCRNPSFNYSGKENALSPYIEAKHIHLQATAQEGIENLQEEFRNCMQAAITTSKLYTQNTYTLQPALNSTFI
jgi:hypothetical protein